VIANEANETNISEIKKRAKSLSDKHFSVMNYDFLNDDFPIRFIDKVVTELPDNSFYEDYSTSELDKAFFEKLYRLKVKVIVVLTSKNNDLSKFIDGKFEETMKLTLSREAIYKLTLVK
jgi:hypothetical protein